MRALAFAPSLVAVALAGCIGSLPEAETVEPSSVLPGAHGIPPLPSGVAAFSHLLCAGDRVMPLLGPRKVACDVQVTNENGPAAEVSIAVSPLDPLNLVGGAKDFTLGEDERCGKYNVWSGVYWSRDGGRTWGNGLLPGYPGHERKTALSDYACGSDPVLAFGPEGNAYYASIHATNDPSQDPPVPQLGPVAGGGSLNAALAVTRSRDGGETWDDPVLLRSRDAGGIFDKEWIAADPETGQLYVTHIDTKDSTLYVQRSDDLGQTWTEPVAIATPGEGLEGPWVHQFGQVAVGPGSVVHYVHWALRQDNDASAIYHRVSRDGGETWAPPVKIADAVMPLDLGVQRKYRVVGTPALGVDAESGAVYVAVPRRNPVDSDIVVVASTDEGRTWFEPVRVNDDLAGPANDQWMPAIAVGPEGTVHATWLDYRDDPAGQWGYIYFSHSRDGGRTWAPNARLSEAPFDGTGGYHQSGSGTIGDYMGLAASPLAVHPFWADTRNGRNDVFTSIVLAG